MNRQPTLRRSVFALLCAAGLAQAAEIDVMTQNQYLGTDLAPVLTAATASPFDPAAFSAAVLAALQAVAATRPGDRAEALAALIAHRHPDVVGLQEVYEFRCDPYPGVPDIPGRGCHDPSVRRAFTDHLADTAAALKGRYRVVGRVTNLSVANLPFVVNGVPALVTVIDRDAILARTDGNAAAVDFSKLSACRPSDQGCNYFTAPPTFDTPMGPLAIERGFLAADLTVHGKPYRVYNTHLEQRLLAPNLPETRLLQVGQAAELAGMALNTWDGVRKVIVTGDFNSDPADTIPSPPYPPAPTPYQVFAGSGFTDAWLMRHPRDAGYSCCQAETLDNLRPAYYERIDLVFSLTPPTRVTDMELLGDRPGDKIRPPFRPGLWPSDHASVAAKLHFD